MGIEFLKRLNQNAPDGLKRIAAPVIRRQLTNNKVFREQFAICQRLKKASEDERLSYQADQLRELCRFAYREVPYYRTIFDQAGLNPDTIKTSSDIGVLPLLTKDVLKSHFNELQADSVKDWYQAQTGGSSGEPTHVNLERSSIYREKAFIYSFWEKGGYDWKIDKIATLRGVDFRGKASKPNPIYNEVLLNPFILNETNVGSYVQTIERFGARFLHGYPSAIHNFCRLIKQAAIRPPRELKAVFFISETVEEWQAEAIEGVLGCPSFAFYGHSERAVFAEQVGRGPIYRFNPLYGVTEILEHSKGNIVCTGFLNRRMPLIRYAVDDWAEPHGTGSMIEGHHDGSFLVGSSGERITQTALNFHDTTFEGTEGYQLVQDEPGRAVCRVVAATRLTPEQLGEIKQSLMSKTGLCITWEVRQEQNLTHTSRGKVQRIIQRNVLNKESRGGYIR